MYLASYQVGTCTAARTSSSAHAMARGPAAQQQQKRQALRTRPARLQAGLDAAPSRSRQGSTTLMLAEGRRVTGLRCVLAAGCWCIGLTLILSSRAATTIGSPRQPAVVGRLPPEIWSDSAENLEGVDPCSAQPVGRDASNFCAVPRRWRAEAFTGGEDVLVVPIEGRRGNHMFQFGAGVVLADARKMRLSLNQVAEFMSDFPCMRTVAALSSDTGAEIALRSSIEHTGQAHTPQILTDASVLMGGNVRSGAAVLLDEDRAIALTGSRQEANWPFFQSSEWLRQYEKHRREICALYQQFPRPVHSLPGPNDAVVYFRDFKDSVSWENRKWKGRASSIKFLISVVDGKRTQQRFRLAVPATAFFTRILDARRWDKVWLVGNPTSHRHPIVQYLQQRYQATIHQGSVDEDFAFLRSAKTLLLV